MNRIERFTENHWPLLIGLIVLYAVIVILFRISVYYADGHFVYATDDAYINMDIAKNFALHGVWGVTRYDFGASTSTMSWIFLLSGLYFIFGVNDFIPLGVNVSVATAMVLFIYFVMKRHKIKPFIIMISILSAIYFGTIPYLIFCGMEQILHLFLYHKIL